MAIVITPETEARLLEKARREGGDPTALANQIISSILDRDEQFSGGMTAQITGSEQSDLVKSEQALTDLLAEQRAKFGFSEKWPYEENETDARVLSNILKSKPDDSVGQQLHIRKARREPLTKDELSTLQIWYDANDAEDLTRFNRIKPRSVSAVQQNIENNRRRLESLIESVRKLAEGNEKIRDENRTLLAEIGKPSASR